MNKTVINPNFQLILGAGSLVVRIRASQEIQRKKLVARVQFPVGAFILYSLFLGQ